MAAYALWLAKRVGVSGPSWADPRKRRIKEPWLSSDNPSLRDQSPSEFSQFNLFTFPDDSFIRRKINRQRLPLSKTKAATVRKMLGLTQKQIAQRIGVSPATFRNWESARIIPSGPADKLLDGILRDPDIFKGGSVVSKF
ncbi:MAG: helix-turn-helix domain-containing protein [Opitutales bacterium]|nr:helix-turn-helix domain-containing protein [Opitutales bacterium]